MRQFMGIHRLGGDGFISTGRVVKSVLGVSQIRSFDDIKLWMQSIETRSADIPIQIQKWETARTNAQNNYNHWNKKCSWDGFWSEVGNAIKRIAEAIVKVSAGCATAFMSHGAHMASPTATRPTYTHIQTPTAVHTKNHTPTFTRHRITPLLYQYINQLHKLHISTHTRHVTQRAS